MEPNRSASRPHGGPIFFDFGGTLAEPLVDLRPLVEELAPRCGVEVAPERYLVESDRAWRELWPDAPSFLGKIPSFADVVHERGLRAAGAKGPVETMVQGLRQEIASPRWHRPYPEAEEVLRALRRRGYPLYVVSNHTDDLPRILRNLGWSDLFAGVTFSQEVGAEKPDPRLFALALRRAACTPAEAIHVGDRRDADYEGARRCGIRALWLDRSGSVDRRGPDVIGDLRELLDRLP